MNLLISVSYGYIHKTMFGLPLPTGVCGRERFLFTLFVFVCAQWCPIHIVLYFCFLFRLVYPVLPVFLGCPFLFATSVFSNVYLLFELINQGNIWLCIDFTNPGPGLRQTQKCDGVKPANVRSQFPLNLIYDLLKCIKYKWYN